jgi:hypothetical protein
VTVRDLDVHGVAVDVLTLVGGDPELGNLPSGAPTYASDRPVGTWSVRWRHADNGTLVLGSVVEDLGVLCYYKADLAS